MTDCEYREICGSPFCPDDPLDCPGYEYFCEAFDEMDRVMETQHIGYKVYDTQDMVVKP